MKYFVNSGSQAEIPKKYYNWYQRALETGSIAVGTPEYQHPSDYWEVIDLERRVRDTNYPDFKPQREFIFVSKTSKWETNGEVVFSLYPSRIRVKNYHNYDFDKLPLEYNVVSHLQLCEKWYYRKSTTGKGLHICDIHDLSSYDDQLRQKATEIRGYSWYWKVKNGEKANLWLKGNSITAIRFLGYGNRKRRRNKPPNHKNYYATVLR